jgi:hypothetical protein
MNCPTDAIIIQPDTTPPVEFVESVPGIRSIADIPAVRRSRGAHRRNVPGRAGRRDAGVDRTVDGVTRSVNHSG